MATEPFTEVTKAEEADALWFVQQTTARPERGVGVPVSSLLPYGFSAYLRLFHPAEESGEERKWRSIADQNGRVFHAQAVFDRLTTPRHGATRWSGTPPDCGQIPKMVVRRLIDVLSRFTADPEECWFGVWEGYVIRDTLSGETKHVRAVLQLPVGFSYGLYRGPLRALSQVAPFGALVPNLWWPEDRQWVVHCAVDFNSTFICCDRAAARELAGDRGLEVLPTRWADATEDVWLNE